MWHSKSRDEKENIKSQSSIPVWQLQKLDNCLAYVEIGYWSWKIKK